MYAAKRYIRYSTGGNILITFAARHLYRAIFKKEIRKYSILPNFFLKKVQHFRLLLAAENIDDTHLIMNTLTKQNILKYKTIVPRVRVNVRVCAYCLLKKNNYICAG